ncbi:MAG: glycosyltransferase family 4 protein [Verrucomicrobiaceae bacterium]|nr:glycosyltransferase family 4 protein [Verrucomicrobiaceae bacterium]
MPEQPTIVLLSKGLARYRYNFTEHFAAALPPEVRVIACPLGSELWEVDWPALKATNGRVEYREFPRSLAELAAWRPTVLCTMEYPQQMLMPMFWAKKHGVPVIVFSDLGVHPPLQKQIPFHTRLQHRLFAHFTDAQVAMAPAALTPHGARHRPVHFAPHSIDTHEFSFRPALPRREGPCRLLYVAGYLYNKGHDLLCKAIQRIQSEVPVDFELRLVGYASSDWVSSVVQEHGLTSNTVITGIKKGLELVQEFQNADLFVFPTRGDTYGVVAQEAAATGLPLLISQFAGASYNLVQEGKNGHIFNPYDVESFARTLGSLMKTPARWGPMGAASRSIAEKFCVRQTSASTAHWILGQWLSGQSQHKYESAN